MSIEKSSVTCHHGKGFHCKQCWPQAKRFRQGRHEFAVLAEFPATEKGRQQANQYMEENQGATLLAVKQGRAILASIEDMGTLVSHSHQCPYEDAFQAVYKQVFDRLAEHGWKYDSWTGMALRPYATASGRKSATTYLWRTGMGEGTVHLRAEFVVDGKDHLSEVSSAISLDGDSQQVAQTVDQFVQDVDSRIADFYKAVLLAGQSLISSDSPAVQR